MLGCRKGGGMSSTWEVWTQGHWAASCASHAAAVQMAEPGDVFIVRADSATDDGDVWRMMLGAPSRRRKRVKKGGRDED